jgi:hypothetical protein
MQRVLASNFIADPSIFLPNLRTRKITKLDMAHGIDEDVVAANVTMEDIVVVEMCESLTGLCCPTFRQQWMRGVAEPR